MAGVISGDPNKTIKNRFNHVTLDDTVMALKHEIGIPPA
jgi:hypothetical protein